MARKASSKTEASPQVLSAANDKGRIYDPAFGSSDRLPAQNWLHRMRFAQKHRAIAHGGAQSEKFVESLGDSFGEISLYWQTA